MGLSSLKVAILGGGVFGRYHAQKAKAHAGVSSLSIYDPDTARAQRVADELGLTCHETLAAALAACDVVVIATPAIYHADLAIAALKAGRHCLIEKPLAHDISHGKDICALAQDKNLIIHVGHQERFVLEAIALNTIVSTPKLIEIHRENLFNPRGTDVSATLDLTIHDLDLVMWLMGGEPLGVLATGSSVETSFIDRSRAELIYGNSKVIIHTNRVAQKGRRTMVIAYPEGTVDIDFNRKTLVNKSPFILNENFGEDVKARDALAASDHAFYEAVLNGTPSVIPPEDGLRALEWAYEIDNLILGQGL